MASLEAAFPQASEDDWRRIAGRGATRVAETDDGIPVRPLYPREQTAAPIADTPGWRAIQRLTGSTVDAVTREAAEALAGGAAGVEIVFETSVHPGRSALPATAAPRLATALAGMPGKDVVVRLDAGPATADVGVAFRHTLPGREGTLVLAHDPVAALAVRGDGANVPDALARLGQSGLARTFFADGCVWHAAGATEVQELAAVIATAVSVLRHSGLAPDRALAATGVALAADADLYLTLAKFRAARLLLALLAETVGSPDIRIPIHAETAWRMTTVAEPRMNALRATIGALGAVAGGAGSLTVLSYDILTKPGEAAARLARNTQSILAGEAHVGRVADPGAGAGAIEALTAALAEQAWTAFQSIEAAGGIVAALPKIIGDIATTRAVRHERMARGAAQMVAVTPRADGAAPAAAAARTLSFERMAAPFEAAP